MRILAIKGGGVRGLLAARLGSRLEQRVPGWSDRLDLIAGTSTGGIIALARAAGIGWKKISVLYQREIPKVFAPAKVGAGAPVSGAELGRLVRLASPSNAELRAVLEPVFEDRTLADLETDVLVPAVSIVGNEPRAHWFTREREGRLKCVDVALATSAAPTHFPSHMGCLDGGIMMNDPSIAALLFAKGGLAKLGLDFLRGEIHVLTLGCGRGATPRGLIDALSSGGLFGPISAAIKLLGENHHELDPRLVNEIPLDGGENLDGSIDELLETANETKLRRTLDWLKSHGWGD